MSHIPKVTRLGGLITLMPSDPSRHSATVIFMHGLGDTSEGWADACEMWAKTMPHVKWLLPTAPTQPVTINMGMACPSWYDIKSLSDRNDMTADGIVESQATIMSLVSKEVESGIAQSQIVIGGFSQGGALALWTGLQSSAPFAGVACLSGYLAGSKNFKLSEACKDTPVAMHHGTSDPVVQLQWAERSKQHLEELGCSNISMSTYPGMPHSACHEEIESVRSWLGKVLPETPVAPLSEEEVQKMGAKDLKAALNLRGMGREAETCVEKEELRQLLRKSL